MANQNLTRSLKQGVQPLKYIKLNFQCNKLVLFKFKQISLMKNKITI